MRWNSWFGVLCLGIPLSAFVGLTSESRAAINVFYSDGALGRPTTFAAGADVTVEPFVGTSLIIVYADNPSNESIGHVRVIGSQSIAASWMLSIHNPNTPSPGFAFPQDAADPLPPAGINWGGISTPSGYPVLFEVDYLASALRVAICGKLR
jgi:hypothetical protein